MRCFYSDTFVLPLPEAHRFPMAKYQRLRERLLQEAIVTADDLAVPDAIDWSDLLRTHDAAYVEAVANGGLSHEMQRRIGFPWSPEMVERSRRSVGATLAAARQALGGGRLAANLAGGTHHAFRDHGEGYCVFNDIAVTAEKLLHEGAVHRALVVDCDVHQGNGTAAIFASEPRVFTLSLHGANNFPFRKELSDLDITFPDNTGDDEYLTALTGTVPRLLDEVRPNVVFYLAGADPYEGDRLGKLALTVEGLRQRDAFVFAACAARGVPVVISMGGGYCPDIDAIVTIHANTIREASRSAQRCLSSMPERKPQPSR